MTAVRPADCPAFHRLLSVEEKTRLPSAGPAKRYWSHMATMRVVQVSRPNGPFEIVERPIPEPGIGSVRIRVQACGVCHSDSLTKEGAYPGIQYPRVPGHEIAGVIDSVGPGTPEWQPGQRVGVGWSGGYCGHCDPCRRGEFFACVTGQSRASRPTAATRST